MQKISLRLRLAADAATGADAHKTSGAKLIASIVAPSGA